MREVFVPDRLRRACWDHADRGAWLRRLPDAVDDLAARWSLTLGAPFDGDDVSCAWVAPAVRSDGEPVVLKLGMPHMEAQHEIEGLRFWSGDPTVRLLDADDKTNAMLLERCDASAPLRSLPEPRQDVVMADLLRRLWRSPPPSASFRPLGTMIAHWSAATVADASRWPDPPLVRAGLEAFQELARPTSADVLLATDLHAGNVLAATRAPWLVIDPKPFIGDPAFDATQHLLNCQTRLRASPERTIHRFADLLEVSAERIRLWIFARSAAEPREDWNEASLAMARLLAP